MKLTYRGAAFAAAFLVGVVGASAQSLDLSAPEQGRLKDWIGKNGVATQAAPAGFTVAPGAELPLTVTIYDAPARQLAIDTLHLHRYARIGDKLVIVGPKDRKILLVIN